MKNIAIAVDGYVAAGKGTLASAIAKKYNFQYLDTGAIYRSVAYAYIHSDIKDLNYVIDNMDLVISDNKVYLNGEDITLEIRKQDVNEMVSKVCVVDDVRIFATNYARKVAKGKSIVMDGRDIASVVLPFADVKFIVTASVEERTKRRYSQNKAKGLKISEEQVKNDIITRDSVDGKNIKVYEDTIIIDNTNQSFEDTFNMMCAHIDRKLGYTYD